MNVWRLGTNWGGISTLDLMLKSKVGFFHIDWTPDAVAEGDIIAIAQPGSKVTVAVGIAATSAHPLSELLTHDEKTGDLSEWVNDAKGFRFKEIWTVPENMQFSTADYKQFYSLGNDVDAWKKAVELVKTFQCEK